MSSRRLPGKVLRAVAGRPLLEFLLERLARCRELAEVVVATSSAATDDPVAAFCRERGGACHRGDLANVASRFRDVVAGRAFDAFVRISGDSPLLDPELVDRAVARFRAGDVDLVTNVHPRTFPPGQSVEVLRGATFLDAYPRLTDPSDREHVTTFFYRNVAGLRLANLEAGADYGDVRMCVDTDDDLALFARVIARMDRPHWTYRLDELARLYRASVAHHAGEGAGAAR